MKTHFLSVVCWTALVALSATNLVIVCAQSPDIFHWLDNIMFLTSCVGMFASLCGAYCYARDEFDRQHGPQDGTA